MWPDYDNSMLPLFGLPQREKEGTHYAPVHERDAPQIDGHVAVAAADCVKDARRDFSHIGDAYRAAEPHHDRTAVGDLRGDRCLVEGGHSNLRSLDAEDRSATAPASRCSPSKANPARALRLGPTRARQAGADSTPRNPRLAMPATCSFQPRGA